ncbi:DUF3551 domain-containing protein [Rhodopseudomonas palustris]|uniref:DUF3551 domain-containing protein n=1 Tax=Rhodopseudomonas palustris TaxID=1076 RepID=UPI002ACD4B51|nr:DUF3551 domain-containing protein [Rhodopseudomonas palustris]WQH00977.1 DUF3551 domain-containing protein [Rhodopseudomonas palustris]
MRKTLLGGMLALLGLTGIAEARDYPVCLRIYQNYRDWYDECSYTSIPQCRMSASGRAAECIENPWYTAPQPAKKKLRKQRRRH